jgi:predicted aldo/keto reductase-like oxidoreductase
MPDNIPLLSISARQVVQTPSQLNMETIVLECLRMGINHFETARMYGTSERQLCHALANLLQAGTIQRSDFILQTKVVALPKPQFVQALDLSWSRLQALEYIDLFSFHVVSKDASVNLVLDDSPDGIYAHVLEWQKQGRIKHIGFSTHGTAENILKMINSHKFSYVNLHYHYFGSYHAEGTSDTMGGQGNAACVRRALELDMGVLNISPIDKGGRLYQLSAKVTRTIGPEMTPIAFSILHSWMTAGMHTVSVGLARPEDLTEILAAVEMYSRTATQTKPLLNKVIQRLDQFKIDALGDEWCQKGFQNVPGPFVRETDGIGLSHILWCYNMMYGT